MSNVDFEDSSPPSDRERTEEWRRTLFSKVDANHSVLRNILTCLYALVALAAVALLRFW
jgi:hypothetical protein